MIYDNKRHNLGHPQGLAEFMDRVEFYTKEEKIVELGMYQHTRSNLQNSSIHLYCKLIAEALNDAGYTYKQRSILNDEIIEIPFTMEMIKEGIWREIQKTLCEIETTTKLTSRMINQIIDVITEWLSAKGILVEFPNKNRL